MSLTHVADIQVKSLSIGKADGDGHTADSIVDALFISTLDPRFRRSGDILVNGTKKLQGGLLEGSG